MRASALLILLAACGPSGNFEVGKKSYSADGLSATTVESEGLSGIDVVLKSDPVRQAVDDEISVRVTLMWPAGTPPDVDKDIFLGGTSLVALVRVGCFCGGKDEAFTEPIASGKVRFSKLSLEAPVEISGDFDAVFKGQIALLQGGILYDDETLKVRAYGFKATK